MAAAAVRVGFIGLGLMGKPMAHNLLRKGFAVVVHNRSRGAVDELVAAGATAATSPARVAQHTTRVITMLPDSPDVEQVLLGSDGVFSAMQPGTIVIDCSSIAPSAARGFALRAKELGASLIDAPVSGGQIGAIEGTLSIMAGGDEAAFNEVKPILDALGNPDKVIRVGDSGSGQVCKVCNQMMIGATLAAVGEIFALARKAGVEPANVRQALLGGFAASRVLEVHGQRILDGNYTPGFRAALYAKDYRIAAETTREHDVPAPIAAVVQQLLTALIVAGRGDQDYSALATVLFDLAGLGPDCGTFRA
jgi:2-hydroxy-3-oxopropionate reductase